MATLHLHLNFEYFDAIKAGTKTEEYREMEKWKGLLDSKKYKRIRLYRGYLKASPDTVIDVPWRGYQVKRITHPHFGDKPVEVCALDVSG